MSIEEMIRDLEHHRGLCRESMDLFNGNVVGAEAQEMKKTLPARLDMSLNSLRRWRQWWRQLSATEREAHPDVAALLQDTLDLMMKSIVLGRESCDRTLSGGVPSVPQPSAAPTSAVPQRPATPTTDRAPVVSTPKFPRAEPQSAHFVARRYKRHAD